ncbi:transglutaminase family protein [Sphingomonas bacterium]|uniref:transglutaminase family protein n=1 Tax=Sphingomonas bacterium TaxID=1895847 RepID=UPI0015763887|nr:transglutaminase family protein [Sphingomonas bacterium]
MRLSIEHRTTYRFTTPQARLVQMLRVTPANSHDQTVASWRLDIDRDARLREGRDGFGNRVTMLYVEGPVEAIEIAVVGEVVTSHSDGVLHGVAESLPAALFLRATLATPPDDAIAAFAREQSGDGSLLGNLHALNEALHERFAIDLSRPEAGVDAAAAFRRDRATPRDLAHIFAVGARSLGAPARYVSGYSVADVLGSHRPTPHGWAEAYVDGIGWIGFDPCTARSPEEEYVRVAIGLDAAGAAPVAGSRLGTGDEQLDVNVQVLRED